MTRCQACLSHHEPNEPCPAAHGFGTAFAELPVVHASPETRALVKAMTAGLPAPTAAPAAPAPGREPSPMKPREIVGDGAAWSPEISPAIERWQRRRWWIARFILAPRPRAYVRKVMLRELWCVLRRRHRWESVEGFTVLRCGDCWRWRGSSVPSLPPPGA